MISSEATSSTFAVGDDDGIDPSGSAVTLTGTLIATVTVFLTTLDDSVWLMPFVGSSSFGRHDRVVHGLAFLVTLVGLAAACCLLAVAIRRGVLLGTKDLSTSSGSTQKLKDTERWLEGVAAVLCWSLALGFCIKKKWKERRRRRKRQEEQQQEQKKQQQANECESEQTPLVVPSSWTGLVTTIGEQATEQEGVPGKSHSTGHPADETDDPDAPYPREEGFAGDGENSTRQPWTVASLTALGFLDEISYFPTLILGGILTVWELMVGTLVAGVLILAIQVLVATQCGPLIVCLDRHVPLYGIIAVFATVLTVHWIWEMLQDGSR